MKNCYSPGCYFDMPCHCPPSCPQPCCNPPCPQNNNMMGGCGYLNIAIPIGLLIFAGGFLLGQKCN